MAGLLRACCNKNRLKPGRTKRTTKPATATTKPATATKPATTKPATTKPATKTDFQKRYKNKYIKKYI